MAEPYVEGDYVAGDYVEGSEVLVSLLGFNVTAFQPDAFQWGFQIMDTIPAFVDFPIPEKLKKVRPGQAIPIICKIADIYTSLGIELPFNPSSVPQLKLYNPDGSVHFDYMDMTFMDTGIYIFEHEVLTNDTSGVYFGQFRAVNGDRESETTKVLLFKVV